MPDIDYDKLAEANVRAMKSAGISGGSGATSGTAFSTMFGGLPGASANLEKSFNPLTFVVTTTSKTFGIASETILAFKGAVDKGAGTWKDLSGSGANFNNDIINMSVSAASARLSLSEFGELVKKNAAGLSFLGGNVADGAKNFAKLSNAMFEGDKFRDTSDNLRAIGYTSADLNDILALTVANQRTSFQNNAQGQAAAIKAAQELAFEMDKNAKLLGISRKEQEKLMESARLDSQVQARFKLIELNEGKEAAQRARDEYNKGLAVATATGTDALYKDLVANNGQVTTQTAAMQQGLLDKQARGTEDLAAATLKGNSDATAAAMRKIGEGALENDNDRNKLQVRTLGDNAKALNDVYGSAAIKSQTFADNLAAVSNDPKFKGKSDKEVMDEVMRRIEASQKSGEGGSGTTRAAVLADARLQDINASLMKGVAGPLNEKIAPKVGAIADKYLSSTVNGRGVATVNTNIAKREFDKSANKTPEDEAREKSLRDKETSSDSILRNIKSRNDQGGVPGSSIVGGIASTIGSITRMTVSTVESLNIDGKSITKQAAGSKDTFGGWFNGPSDLITQMNEGGMKEAVVPQAKLGEFMSDMNKQLGNNSGMNFGQINSNMGNMLNGMLSNIKTTVSSAETDSTGHQAPKPSTSPIPVPTGGNAATMTDLREQLIQLNKGMMQLISHSADQVNVSEKQVRVIRSSSNNIFD